MKRNIEKEIKIALVNRELSMGQLVAVLHERFNRSPHAHVLTRKLKAGTIRFDELEEIFDVLGYDIDFNPRDNWIDPTKE